MSKGLEALKRIVCNSLNEDYSWSKELENDEAIVEQELKALKLICEYVGKEQILFFMRQANASKEERDLVRRCL